MEKLKMHSPNLTQDNIARIRDLFPGCVTEVKGEDGSVKLAVDFDQLRQELAESIVEGPQERYHLNWPGKREALLTANAPIAKTLRPSREESVDFDTTKNLFIEGDNLDALKLLQETYLGKVKMIYIDPPYNTGNDFIYEDDFAEEADDYLRRSNQKDAEGNRLIANPVTNGRFHSDWLTMLFSRLKLARSLLSDDGAIFISIDDCEVSNLRKVCDEIFGDDCFMAELVWKSRQIVDSRNLNNVSKDHEYILVYAKNGEKFSLKGKPISAEKYKNPDGDPRGPWMSNSMLGLADAAQRPNLHYDLEDPKTGLRYPCPPESGWRYSKTTMQEKINDGRVIFPASPDGRPREKKYIQELSSEFTGFSSILPESVGYTLNGSRELRELFGDKFFDFPKPVSLIETLIQQATNAGDIVLDFFAGSGTTGHACFHAAATSGIERRFILIQLPEPISETTSAFKAGFKSISALSIGRLSRASARAKSDLVSQKIDLGFRVLKVDTSNMADVYYAPDALDKAKLDLFVDNIKSDRTPEDLLFQVMLDWGVDLALPINKQSIQGKDVFFVDGNVLAACFDASGSIDEAFVKELAKHHPLRVVFRDAGYKNSAVKINVEQIFKLLSPATEVKCI